MPSNNRRLTTYSSKARDVRKLEQELAAARATEGDTKPTAELKAQLDVLSAELDVLQKQAEVNAAREEK